MPVDIGQELYEKIKAEFDKLTAADGFIKAVAGRISAGTATMEDVSLYAQQLGVRLRQVLGDKIRADVLPNGQMYYNIAEKILGPILHDNYDLVNQTAADVQRILDKRNNINIKPQKAAFPDERVQAICNAAKDQEAARAAEIMGRASDTVSRSFADDYMEENAKFRSKAGFQTYIVRATDGKCCDWCSRQAGKYSYPDATPHEVFQRHDNCGCTVTYENGGMRQDVWSKRTWQASPEELAERRELEEKLKPVRFSPEEAAAKERKLLEQRAERLTNGGESGILESISNQQDFMDRNPREQLSRYVNDPKTGERVLEKWSFRTNPMGEYLNIFSQTYSEDARTMAEYLNEKVNNGDYGKVDRIVIAKNEDLRGISSYDHTKNTLYISEELITKEGFDRIVDKSYFPARNLDDILTHELDGHKRHWDIVKKFYNNNLDKYSSLKDAKQDFERPLREYIVKQQSSDYFYVSKIVSENAGKAFIRDDSLNELIADSTVIQHNGEITDELLFDRLKELMKYDAKS